MPLTSSPVLFGKRKRLQQGDIGGRGIGGFDSHLYDNLVPQQGEVFATFTVRYLEIVGHLQGLLVGIQAHTVLGWEVANASQHFSLPPVRIRIVNDSHLRRFHRWTITSHVIHQKKNANSSAFFCKACYYHWIIIEGWGQFWSIV